MQEIKRGGDCMLNNFSFLDLLGIIVLFLFAIYLIGRLLSTAYFRSYEDYKMRINHQQPKDKQEKQK